MFLFNMSGIQKEISGEISRELSQLRTKIDALVEAETSSTVGTLKIKRKSRLS